MSVIIRFLPDLSTDWGLYMAGDMVKINMMTNPEIRRKILEMAYAQFQENPYYRITPGEFKEKLNVHIKELHFNIVYLEEKGFLELQKPVEGSLFVSARITARGIDLVEDEYQLAVLFPVKKDTTQAQINVFKEFDLIVDKITNSDVIGKDTKELIVEEVKEIQKELKKIQPSYHRIKTVLDLLRPRDADVVRDIITVLNNPVINQLLAESAKKELS